MWRRIDEYVTAVVDPAMDAMDDDDDDDDDDDGGLGPSSPDVALAAYLRSESEAQRRAMTLSEPPAFARCATVEDAENAVVALERDGAVFLSGVVRAEVCDAVLEELNAVCDAARETVGEALRRTDVKLGFEGATRDMIIGACGSGGVGAVLSRIGDATEEAVMVEMSVLATEKGADRQVLHPDVAYDAPHAPLYSLFIALQDVVPEMGPTCFVLGTQDEASHDAFPATKWGDEQFALLGEKRCCDATLRKGDAVLYDARTFHQGGENAYGRRALMTLTFLKPPIPEAPTRRNANAEWSIRKDVFDACLTVGQLAAMDETTTTRV